MMIALTEGALADLKAESRALYESREETASENRLLVAENDRLKAQARIHEMRIEGLNAELRQAEERGAQLADALERERAQAQHLKGELDDQQDVIERNDSLISQLQLDLSSARDEIVFARQHAEMLQANLAEAQERLTQLESDLAQSRSYAGGVTEKMREIDIALDSERRQLAKLEELLASSQKEHQEAQAQWRAQNEDDRRQIAELEARTDELTARGRAAEQLLAELRADLQSRSDQCRASDRHNQEMEQRLLRLSEQAEGVALENAQLKEKLEARERAHARLARRARGLIRGMRDLAANLEKSEQKAMLAGERITAEADRFDAQKAQYEQTLRDLVEQLEKERAANQVTAGALEAARQQRLQPRGEEPPAAAEEDLKLADILARAEEAHLAAEAHGRRAARRS
jgi:chromosome segregation ATPase